MTIAIIGGSGFIGTRLTRRLLAAGHAVKILDKQDSKYYSELRTFADVRDIDSLKQGLNSKFGGFNNWGGKTGGCFAP